MERINRKYIEKVFYEYTCAYNVADPKIKLKIDHTYRVANLCEIIAKDIGLTGAQIGLAWLMVLLYEGKTRLLI